jgi:transposase
MRTWLLERGVTIVAMKSTSTSWKAPFYCLEEVLEVWVLNAAHIKAVPGRRTRRQAVAGRASWPDQRPRPGDAQPR